MARVGTIAEVAGASVLVYVGYRVVEGLVQQANKSASTIPQQIGTDVGGVIAQGLNDLRNGAVAAFKQLMKQAGWTIAEFTVAGVAGYAVFTQAGQLVGYFIKQGVTWIFSKKPPSGPSGGNTAPISPPAPAPTPTPAPSPPTNTQPIGAQPTPTQAQSLLSRVESLLRSGRAVAASDIQTLITYHKRGLVTSAALMGLAAILVLVQPELAPAVAAAAMT